ncbi:MAG: AAA family ATPase [Cytophagaceae bacterium]|nr:AAA family ATPase [Cytophagaceae bacterium]
MKLRKIKWENHPVLQNLELNFVNSAKRLPFNSIFLIGENGCGKTTVMESLSEFLCGGPFSFFNYIEYELNNNIYQVKNR